jgi:two-component system sensor histidine kinase VicK
MKGIRFFQTIQMKLIIIYVLLILISMQLIGVYFVSTLKSSFLQNFSDDLSKQAYLIAEYVKPYMTVKQQDEEAAARKKQEDLNNVVTNLNTISGAEIQVIDASGVVLSTSLIANRPIIGQKTTQTEVNRALQGIKFNEWEMVDASGMRVRAIAMPVSDSGKVLGAVYIEAPMDQLFANINRINRIFISGTLIALALTALLSVILSNTITKPIKEITKKATAMAEGNFNQRVKVVNSDEIGQLGNAFNYMTNRLKEALSLNEEEKEKLASILLNMSDGVIATDDMGRVIVVNRRAKQILQVEEHQAIGKDIAELLDMPKEEIGRYILSDVHTGTAHLYHPDEDENVTVRLSFSPIHRRGRGITGTIAVLQDITEQEKLEQSRREFVANVSHELRTPLTTIKSYLEALDDGAMEDPELAKKFLGVTRNEAERMIRLVHDLLHLSRFDSKQAVMSKEAFDIKTVLEDVADRFSFQMKQKAISVKLNIEEGLPPAVMDSDQIDQVLDNLVSNAIKYTLNEGKLELRAIRRDKDWVEVTVIDTGIGIPKKHLSKIFDRFYRADKARSRNMGGTGLGLSIAREIVKAHGGTISIDSDPDFGTQVSFTLPLQSGGSEAI